MVSDKKVPKYLEISNNRFIFASQSKRFRLMIGMFWYHH